MLFQSIMDAEANGTELTGTRTERHREINRIIDEILAEERANLGLPRPTNQDETEPVGQPAAKTSSSSVADMIKIKMKKVEVTKCTDYNVIVSLRDHLRTLKSLGEAVDIRDHLDSGSLNFYTNQWMFIRSSNGSEDGRPINWTNPDTLDFFLEHCCNKTATSNRGGPRLLVAVEHLINNVTPLANRLETEPDYKQWAQIITEWMKDIYIHCALFEDVLKGEAYWLTDEIHRATYRKRMLRLISEANPEKLKAEKGWDDFCKKKKKETSASRQRPVSRDWHSCSRP